MTDTTPWPGPYEANGVEIYRESFSTIRSETAADLAGMPADAARVLVRMIHSCGMTDLATDFALQPERGQGRAAGPARRRPGAVRRADGGQRHHPGPPAPGQRDRLHTQRTGVPELAAKLETTRSAAAIDLWMDRLEGGVVAIGNAPTALFRLLELIRDGAPRPAAILGIPVGFIGAAESKLALSQNPLGLEYLVVHGRRGGSAMTVGAVNAIASEKE